MKNKNTIIIAVIVIIIASILNFPNITINEVKEPTATNLAVSILYLLIWSILSIYSYKKKDIIFSKLMCMYWSISTIISLYLIMIYLADTEMNLLLFPFFLICYSPFDGFMKLMGTTTTLIIISTICIIFIIIAIFINKHSKE